MTAIAKHAKHLVSKKKRRFIEDGFDLDMTFITRNIVAMGFPAEGREGIYRNHMRDVKRFFDTRHQDHYKVYNLCSERTYDSAKFYDRVAKYPFDDHNAPPFLLMKPFCEDVQKYLAEDDRNVAVIHCKAGKGRTGVMISAFLLHCGLYKNTADALEFYGHARTMNGKGVTIPSQVRYVYYYGRSILEPAKRNYQNRTLSLEKIVFKGVPDMSNGTSIPAFVIRHGPEQVVTYKSPWFENISKDQKEAVLALDKPQPVNGDIKIEFIHKKGSGKEKLCHLWLNTFFVDDLKFTAKQPEIDKANKDKKNKIFPVGFAIEIYFQPIEGESSSNATTNTADATGVLPEPPGPKNVVGRSVAAADAKSKLTHQDSTVSQSAEWSDSDLTTEDEEEDDDWEGLPISDV